MRNEIGMLCLHEKSRNREIGTLILCWNPVTTQNLQCSLLWCLVGHSRWPRSPLGFHAPCRLLMLQIVLSWVLPWPWFVTVIVVEMNFWFIFLSLPFHRYMSVLLPAFSDTFTSLYFKVTLLIPSHHYKRCRKSEVMDLYHLLCLQLLIFKAVNLIFCLLSSPCNHEIAI